MAIYTLSWQDGIEIARIAPAGSRIISALDRATAACQVNLLVTCATGGHPAADPHTRGEAYDVRTRDLAPAQIVRVYTFLTDTLGPLFTVLYEVPFLTTVPQLQAIAYLNASATAAHFHVQLKKHTVYPPASPTITEDTAHAV